MLMVLKCSVYGGVMMSCPLTFGVQHKVYFLPFVYSAFSRNCLTLL